MGAPYIFGILVGNGTNTTPLTIGYLLGATIMFAGGIIAFIFGVNAERQSLEDIATPLSVVSSPIANNQ